MKFKLIEKFDETRSMVQEYMYDAMDELNNASLEEYIQWFKDNLTAYPEDIEQAVTDAYIEACDYGMIKGVEKTRLTSELKEYIESHTDIIDNTDELMKQCPGHLQHELKIVLNKLDESLTEELLTEEKLYRIDVDNNEFFVIAGNKQQFNSVKDVLTYIDVQSKNKESINDELYKQLKKHEKSVCNITDYTNSITKDDPRLSRTINKTFSTLRKRSNKTLKREVDSDAVKPEDLSKVIVHHVDGNEFNDDKDNLIGLFSSNLHHILHKLSLTKHGSTYAWSGTQKVLVYNGKKYVPKTMTISIDV